MKTTSKKIKNEDDLKKNEKKWRRPQKNKKQKNEDNLNKKIKNEDDLKKNEKNEDDLKKIKMKTTLKKTKNKKLNWLWHNSKLT